MSKCTREGAPHPWAWLDASDDKELCVKRHRGVFGISLMRLSRSAGKKPVRWFKYFPQFSFKTGDKRAKTVWQQNYRMQIREQQLGLYETENRQKFP